MDRRISSALKQEMRSKLPIHTDPFSPTPSRVGLSEPAREEKSPVKMLLGDSLFIEALWSISV